MNDVQTPSVNGHAAINRMPAGNTGQRLVRVPDWVHDGPYWLVASSNNQIVRMEISTNRAADYLDQLGMRPFDIDVVLYHAELWARRNGSQRPLYPLRESDSPVMWDLWTESEVK
jgi:hypothetical protein